MANNFRRTITSMIILFLLSTFSSFAQGGKDQPMNLLSPDSLLSAAKTIIDSSACRVLITVGEDGKPYAREMTPFPIEKDWVIWLGTSTISRKVKQIQNNPDVIVYYYDPKGLSYVSVAGKASLVNDSDLKAKYWVDAYKIYYTDRDKDYILIKVVPENLEVVSYKYKIFWNSNTDPQIFNFAIEKSK
jgi:general stress protein 26